VVITGVATLAYTLFGGMRSVVWNDCLQFVIYMLAGLATLGILVRALPGGSEQLWQYALEHQKLRVIRWDWNVADTYTVWAGVIGGAFLSLGTHGTDQIIVQRFLSARNMHDAGKALFLSGWVVLAQFALFLMIGVGLACFYATFPENAPLKGDQAYAAFIVRYLPTGLVGLTLAGVLSAAMSTLSSSLNSSAAAVVGDFGGLFGSSLPKERQLLFSQLLTVIFGVVQMGVAVAAAAFSQSVVNDALSIAGFTAGILFGVFLLGLLPWRISPAGAVTGMLAGLAVLLAVKFGPVYLPQMFPVAIAWPWYPVIGSLTTVGVGAAVSQFIPESRPS
jgi:SSS family transporter